MVSNNNNVARVQLASFVAVLICVISLMSCASTNAQLTSDFYSRTCPRLHSIVHDEMRKAVLRERRMAASILRLFFHDCFVNGCDGSVLLDDTDTFTGEQNAFPNQNSARGFEVIDAIKSRVEAACPATVSCADILALASRDGVELVGGPSWKVRLGRRDARTASQAQANSDLPSPFVNLSTLISMFAAKGLNAQEMTVLSGAHTIGFAQCGFFKTRIYNETNIDPLFAAIRRRTCPVSGGDSNLTSIDTSTPNLFDNSYYWNLVNRRGLFHSDQELFNGGSQDNIVRSYSVNPGGFARDFANAMVKMGNISQLTGSVREIRKTCGAIN